VFQGAVQLNLDSKGRLAIPAKHRDALLSGCEGRLVLTADHQDACLLLYPEQEWRPIRDQLQKLPSLNPQVRNLQRRLIGYAEELQMDAAGRVLVSPALRGFARLERQVMLVGQGNRFEIWDEARWNALNETMIGFGAGDLPPGLEGFTL
jgi:MraZ protein